MKASSESTIFKNRDQHSQHFRVPFFFQIHILYISSFIISHFQIQLHFSHNFHAGFNVTNFCKGSVTYMDSLLLCVFFRRDFFHCPFLPSDFIFIFFTSFFHAGSHTQGSCLYTHLPIGSSSVEYPTRRRDAISVSET